MMRLEGSFDFVTSARELSRVVAGVPGCRYAVKLHTYGIATARGIYWTPFNTLQACTVEDWKKQARRAVEVARGAPGSMLEGIPG